MFNENSNKKRHKYFSLPHGWVDVKVSRWEEEAPDDEEALADENQVTDLKKIFFLIKNDIFCLKTKDTAPEH